MPSRASALTAASVAAALIVDTSPLDPTIKISPDIGAATGLEFLRNGQVLAAAEPVRGTSAQRRWLRWRDPPVRMTPRMPIRG